MKKVVRLAVSRDPSGSYSCMTTSLFSYADIRYIKQPPLLRAHGQLLHGFQGSLHVLGVFD